MIHLGIRGAQQFGQLHPIRSRLVEHEEEFTVCKHEFCRFGSQTLLHILGDAGQHGPILSEPFPTLIEEFTAVLVDAALAPPGAAGEEQVDLVDIDVSVPALLPVTDNTVEYGVKHDQQAHGLEVLAQILNVKAQ